MNNEKIWCRNNDLMKSVEKWMTQYDDGTMKYRRVRTSKHLATCIVNKTKQKISPNFVHWRVVYGFRFTSKQQTFKTYDWILGLLFGIFILQSISIFYCMHTLTAIVNDFTDQSE
jgi:hypothetical protein